MHTMQEQPGRCLGCLVVVAMDGPPASLVLLAIAVGCPMASGFEDSWTFPVLRSAPSLCFFSSVQ